MLKVLLTSYAGQQLAGHHPGRRSGDALVDPQGPWGARVGPGADAQRHGVLDSLVEDAPARQIVLRE